MHAGSRWSRAYMMSCSGKTWEMVERVHLQRSPGAGSASYAVQAITSSDYMAVSGVVLATTVFSLLIYLVVDLLYLRRSAYQVLGR